MRKHGPQKIASKAEVIDFYHGEGRYYTLQEAADRYGISRERARQLRVDSGALEPIRTLTQAMVEIRRLRAILDDRQHDLVASVN